MHFTGIRYVITYRIVGSPQATLNTEIGKKRLLRIYNLTWKIDAY